ncbi:MAG: 16S rRNA (cytidine(1402)-2'-O)-methyltransferase [Alphaproteobacteria bacterium]
MTDRASKRPGLYLVATPIGNLGDITLRALEILRRADMVACEDTRHTGRLLSAHGINAKTTSYHDHNAPRVRPILLARLAAGETVALVSDAGTPLISDPGYRLVAEAAAAGIPVYPIPGASSVLAALCVAGLPTDRFLFLGFAPSRAAARGKFLQPFATVDATLVILESPKRLAAALTAMAEIFGDRPAAICREMTKLHEEIVRGALGDLAQRYAAAPTPKGEVVIVIAPPEAGAMAKKFTAAEIDALLRARLADEKPGDAAAHVAAETGIARRTLYSRAVALKKSGEATTDN